MTSTIKKGTYKVEIEITLEEDVTEAELDHMFEDAMYLHSSKISSSDIGEYVPVSEKDKKTVMA